MGSFFYMLANPEGLYVAGIDDQQLLLPDNLTPGAQRRMSRWSATTGRIGVGENT
jgi:hypothetical protein